jgi:hypothetical protein
MKITLARLVFLVLCLIFAFSVQADMRQRTLSIPLQSELFAKLGETELLVAQIDATLSALPEEGRIQVLSSPDQFGRLLDALAVNTYLYERASRERFLEPDGPLAARVYQAAIEAIANNYVRDYLAGNQLESYEQRARELWLSNPEDFQSPELVDFTHVLIRSGNVRGEVEAIERILAVYQSIDDGREMEELATEFSDDPAVESNQGSYRKTNPAELDGTVRQTIEALTPGQISQPIRSSFGWHIVRLDAIHEPEALEWEDARPKAVERARREHRQALVNELQRQARQGRFELAEGALQRILEKYRVPSDAYFSEDQVLDTITAEE